MLKNFLISFFLVLAITAIVSNFSSVKASTSSSESMKQIRDLQRLSDFKNLQKGINFQVKHASHSGVLCNFTGFPCTGDSVTDSRASNGAGWVKVDLSQFVFELPIDPINTADGSGYHYTYCANQRVAQLPGYLLLTKLESQKYAPLMATDGGVDPYTYEAGSNLNIACTY